MSDENRQVTEAAADSQGHTESVVRLAQELIRHPSRAGLDNYGPVLRVVEEWLSAQGLPHRRLYGGTGGACGTGAADAADSDAGKPAGLLVELPGGRPGPWWTLDACLDTAPYGDENAWSFPPACGDVADGWLLGRGSADSKLAAAMFCHLAADLLPRTDTLRGGLALLLDVGEHTGRFGGARAYLADPTAARPAGVMIGYPGATEVVVGGRGLWRATLAVHAPAGHSGSRRKVVGAISRAAHLVRLLDAAQLPTADADPHFPLPPKLSVTSFHGGHGFSVTPDLCEVNVDVRTTPGFAAHDAETLVRETAARLDAELPAPRPTDITPVADWPPFRLTEDEQPARALLRAATDAGFAVRPKTAGPSNIGNLLAGEGIPATAGFGVPYEGLHGINERAHLAELPRVFAAYRQAVLSLLQAHRTPAPRRRREPRR